MTETTAVTDVRAEAERLQTLAGDNHYGSGLNASTIDYSFRVFSRHFVPGTCLELGPAEGLMTARLQAVFDDLTVVEASPQFCASLQQRYPFITVVEALFEQYKPTRRFDNVVLGHVLEHVIDPVSILQSVRHWMTPHGHLLAAVPNAHSIHRQLAVVMGVLDAENTLNDTDARMGHRRVYTLTELRDDVRAAGFAVRVDGGYWLKPLSNAQIERDWTAEMIAAAMQVGERTPDIAGEIYIVAAPSE
ncbi:MAG: class I SAM-dependent methyltransferase [Candidatus Dormibacteraeota bacterium]|nr:class I SAM-dependent methyltransferase [Candidatus Dormibacteraeota bacterium]